MTNPDRIRLHELVYARASFLEAEGIAKQLGRNRYAGQIASALITAMAVAYYRPFMGSMRPDGSKGVPIKDAVALRIDRGTHLNLRKFRHEICAHKDLSALTTNIPIVKVLENGSMEIHSVLAVAIELDECERIRDLCLKLVAILQTETAGLLKGLTPPAKGEYTLNHAEGFWLIPLNRQKLASANLVREAPSD